MKKVVMTVNNEFTTDYRVFREATALVQAGYDVTVFCVHRDGLPREQEKAGVHVRRILDAHLRLPISRQARAIRKVWWNALIASQADIYHAHDRDALDLSARAARRRNVPLIYDSHEFWPDKNQYENNSGSLRDRVSEFIWTWRERTYSRKASAIIMTSAGHAQGLRLAYRVQAPVLVRNIPEYQRGNDRTILKKKFNLGDSDQIIVYFGNIQRNRGIEQAIAALRELPSAVHLVIIGYGPYRDVLKKQIAHDLVERVHFHDAIPFEQIINTLYSADVGLASFQDNCFSHRYVLPNKPFEYMLAELPIVASDLPELRRLVSEVGYGELFVPNDVHDLARALKKVLSDQALRERYRAAARQASETTYRWDLEKKRLLDLYKRITP